MTQGILFDLDGTLFDTLEDLTASVNASMDAFGCPRRSREEVRRFVGNGARRLIVQSLPGGDSRVDEVLAFYQAHYEAHCRDTAAPYPGIMEALAELRENYSLGIVSNKPDGAVKALCGEYFPGIYALGESPDCPRKPAPDMLYRAMETLGVDRCVYVGDSEVDIATARNAGLPCISVCWGFRDEETLTAAGAEVLCREAAALPKMIEEIFHGK